MQVISRTRALRRVLAHPILVAFIVIMALVGAGTWALMSASQSRMIEHEALRIAEIVSRQATTARTVYSRLGYDPFAEHVANRTPHGKPMPLPAEFLRTLGEAVSSNADELFRMRLVSGWNLSPRNALRDDFERWGWSQLLRQDPVHPTGPVDWQPVWRIEGSKSDRTLRFLRADPAATEACAACHVAAESTPAVRMLRNEAGELRAPSRERHQLLGAVAVTIPLVAVEALAASHRMSTLALLTGIFCLGMVAAAWFVLRDIRQKQTVHARLERQATHDALTGLPNRALFTRQVDACFAHWRSKPRRFTVLFIDLDRFKLVNDSQGHQCGDAVLVAIAARLRESLQPGETAARLSGDEFALLLIEPDALSQLHTRIRELQTRLARPIPYAGPPQTVGTSIGVSRFPSDGVTIEELLRKADAAMYRVKEDGRNAFVLYQPVMDTRRHHYCALRAGMHDAIDREQLLLYYQPICDVATRRVVAVEALLRWQHPEYGLVPPAQFLPIAEDLGMMRAIDDWVIGEALRQRVAWNRAGLPPFRIHVNLSPARFQETGLMTVIDRALNLHGATPDMLTLEITEHTFARRADRVRETLLRCHRRGLVIALDDFGTGYSSLSMLKQFPIDLLKIDKSFVDGLPEDRNDCVLATAIIGLCRNLAIDVIAEGVETTAQFDYLVGAGCRKVQGHLIARPLQPGMLETAIRDDAIALPSPTHRPFADATSANPSAAGAGAAGSARPVPSGKPAFA